MIIFNFFFNFEIYFFYTLIKMGATKGAIIKSFLSCCCNNFLALLFYSIKNINLIFMKTKRANNIIQLYQDCIPVII